MPKITRPSLATKCNWSAKSEIGKSRQHVKFPPQLTIAPPIPCLVLRRKTSRISCISLPIHNMHKLMQTCIYMLDHPALWMFLTPGPSFVEKYIHVRRAWPSLGQVHSEFGSELEQPLATRLHWTKGRNMSDKLSKKKNKKKSQNKSFISQTLASLPGTQMIVQNFSGRNQPMPEDHYCHSSVIILDRYSTWDFRL